MGSVTRLIPRTPQGIRFMLEHEYTKLAKRGLLPETNSWPKMLRALRMVRVMLIAQQTLEEVLAESGDDLFIDPLFRSIVKQNDVARIRAALAWYDEFDPDDAA